MPVKCPVCGKDMRIIETPYEIPYFGKAVLFSMICSCGYKFSDVILPEAGNPVRYKIKVNANTLSARVVKSSSATVKIPELEIEVLPGQGSEGYISNVEGVLLRVENGVKTAMLFSENEKQRKRAEEIIQILEKARNGEIELTLVIEDPSGNSAIIHELAEREEMK